MYWTCAPDAQRTGEPLSPLHSFYGHNFGEQRKIPPLPGLRMTAALSLDWSSLDSCAGFPLSPSLNTCKVNRSWQLTVSNVLQKRNLNSAEQLSHSNKLP